jgi:hypothetical protein
MKKSTLVIFTTLLVSITCFGQSETYTLLKEKFRGHENVFSISTSGFFTRTILLVAGEHDFNKALREVKHIQLTTIPKKAFHREEVTVKGFIRKAKEDAFEELVHVKDYGDDVTLLRQQPKKKNRAHRYLLVVDDRNEVIVMEITGYIDHERLFDYYKKQNNHHYRKI